MKQRLFYDEEVEEMVTTVSLKRQMETIQRLMYMALGGALTFLLFTLEATDIGRAGFILWLMLFLGPPAVSLLLLISPTWRLLPLENRINPVLMGLCVSWLATFIFFVSSFIGYGVPLGQRMLFLLFTAGYLLGIIRFGFFLRHRNMANETLFP